MRDRAGAAARRHQLAADAPRCRARARRRVCRSPPTAWSGHCRPVSRSSRPSHTLAELAKDDPVVHGAADTLEPLAAKGIPTAASLAQKLGEIEQSLRGGPATGSSDDWLDRTRENLKASSICIRRTRRRCRARTRCSGATQALLAAGSAGRGRGAEAAGRAGQRGRRRLGRQPPSSAWPPPPPSRPCVEQLQDHAGPAGLSAEIREGTDPCFASCSSSSSRALLAWAAVWVVNHPGTVAVQWLDQELILSVGTVIAVLLVFAALAVLAVRAAALAAGPAAPLAHLAQPPAAGARLRGADARPDGRGRRRPQRRPRPSPPGRALLPDNGSLLLLSAQTAQLEGKEEVAHLKFRQMLDRRDAEFVGLRGLLAQSMKTGEYDEALTLARRAYRRSPTTPWVLTTLFELLARAEKWDEALPLVAEMQAQKLLDDGQARHKRSVLHHMLATRLRAAGSRSTTRWSQAARRSRRSPASRPAAVQAAELALQAEPPPAGAAAARGRLARPAAPRHRPRLRPARSERDAEPSGCSGSTAGWRRLQVGPPRPWCCRPSWRCRPATGAPPARGWRPHWVPHRRPASTGCWPRWSGSRGGDAAKAQEWLARATDAEPGSRLGVRRYRRGAARLGSRSRRAAASTPCTGPRRPGWRPCCRPRRPPTSCRVTATTGRHLIGRCQLARPMARPISKRLPNDSLACPCERSRPTLTPAA